MEYMSNGRSHDFVTYRSAAMAHAQATRDGDYRKANREYDALLKTYKRLISIPNGEALFLNLLSDASPAVRLWAAAMALEIDSEKARATLNELSREKGIVGFTAQQTLKQFATGAWRRFRDM